MQRTPPRPILEDFEFASLAGPEAPGVASAPGAAQSAGEQREAIVVEDDVDIGRLLKFILEREGFKITLYPDGRIANLRLESNKIPSLVILDVMLPYVSGYELLSIIRKSPTWKDVPVLMLTAKSRELDVVRALDHGANDYVTKPFHPAELTARIRRLVPPS